MAVDARVKCLVVGAGPVGALAALYAADRGWDVEVYELRGGDLPLGKKSQSSQEFWTVADQSTDLRHDNTTPLNFTKSINLALSERGINAIRELKFSNVLQEILSETIPMHGRMIHGSKAGGEMFEQAQKYDVHGRSILAVDRASLNKMLLNALEDRPNVKLLFQHKLTGADLVKKKAWFEQSSSHHSRQTSGSNSSDPQANASMQRNKEIEVDFDVILGCDGAHSSVRYHMMKFLRMSYQQTYIDVLWCEFTMLAAHQPKASDSNTSTSFAISPNHLHIWPGAEKMFIAIPSTDKSFTCTLFASANDFAALERDPSGVEKFFDNNFPGAAQLIGRSNLQEQFTRNPHLPLISIKCSPHHFRSTAVILGDAAHAMVPFYGQGMNAGLEDVRILFSHLDARDSNLEGIEQAFSEYSAQRVPDAHTINDLALANYWEMRAGVRSPVYLLRKKIEEFLADKVPRSGFLTQYSRVSFSNQRYSEVAKAVTRQATILASAMIATSTTPLILWLAWRLHAHRKPVSILGSLWKSFAW